MVLVTLDYHMFAELGDFLGMLNIGAVGWEGRWGGNGVAKEDFWVNPTSCD